MLTSLSADLRYLTVAFWQSRAGPVRGPDSGGKLSQLVGSVLARSVSCLFLCGTSVCVRYQCNHNQSKLSTKRRVPNTYQITAYRQIPAFVAGIVFNNLFVFSGAREFKSPSGHHRSHLLSITYGWCCSCILREQLCCGAPCRPKCADSKTVVYSDEKLMQQHGFRTVPISADRSQLRLTTRRSWKSRCSRSAQRLRLRTR